MRKERSAGRPAAGPTGEDSRGRRTAREVPLPEELPESTRILATRCIPVQRFLAKARTGTALTGAERHVLVHLFAHVGQEGSLFVHQVLAQAGGYDPDAVDREIHAVSPQAIGCHRIRQILELDVIADECNCVFRLPTGGYATPLGHLDRFPKATVASLRTSPEAVDLDGEGRVSGYTRRKAKAAAQLDEIDRVRGAKEGPGLLRSVLNRLLGRPDARDRRGQK